MTANLNHISEQSIAPTNPDGFNTTVFKQDRVEVLSNNKGWLRVRNTAATTGAAVMPITPDGKVLLVQESRFVDDQWQNVWNIPRGAGGQHESSIDTAVRELQEETGIRVNAENMVSLGRIHPDNGFLLSSIDIYAATLDWDPSNLHDWSQENGECTDLKWWSPDELELAVANGEFTDSVTLSALAAWRGYRRNLMLTQGEGSVVEPVKLNFPVMLRKMWSGSEVQAWLNEQAPLYSAPQDELSEVEALKAQVADLKVKYSQLRDTHLIDAIELGIKAGIQQAKSEASGIANAIMGDETLIYEHVIAQIELSSRDHSHALESENLKPA